MFDSIYSHKFAPIYKLSMIMELYVIYFSLPNNSAGWNKSAGWQNLEN